jgi:hypothetical protein
MNLRLNILHPTLLILVVLIVYLNTVVGSQFVFDDEQFILKNVFHSSWEFFPKYFTENLVAGAGIQSNLYRPLELVTHKLDLLIWGYSPWGHKLTNLALFAGLLAALYQVIRQLLSDEDTAQVRWVAFSATLLFGLHPLQSADVGYISGRSELMMILFGCLCLLHFRSRYWLSLLFYTLALLSKESALVWPAMLLGYDWITNRNPDVATKWQRFAWKKHLGLWSIGATYLALRFTVLNFKDFMNFYSTSNVLTENFHYRLFTWFSSLAKGLHLIVWPTDIHHQRHWMVYPDYTTPIVIVGSVILVSFIGIGVWQFRKRPLITLGLLWFISATIPTSNVIVLVNALFYDHWYLLPSLGLFLCFAYGLNSWLASDHLTESKRTYAAIGVTGLMVLGFLPWTLKQNDVWRTRENLYTYIYQFEPNSITVLNNLGMEYSGTGRNAQAKEMYLKAIAIDDSRAETRHNLGMIFLEEQKFQEAVDQYVAAIKINPNFYHSYYWIGRVFTHLQQFDKAMAAFQKALSIHNDPRTLQAIESLKTMANQQQPKP